MAIPLNAPGQATLGGIKSGQDFMKGVEDIKSARQSRKESEQNIKASQQSVKESKSRVESTSAQTEALNLEMDEFKKDLDAGLYDAQRLNNLQEASIKAIQLDVLEEVAKVDKEYAGELARTGALTGVIQAANKLSAAENEAMYNIRQRYDAELITYDEARAQLMEISPKIGSLPEDEMEGAEFLGLAGEIALKSTAHLNKMEELMASASDAVNGVQTEVMINGVLTKQLVSPRTGQVIRTLGPAEPSSAMVDVNLPGENLNKKFIENSQKDVITRTQTARETISSAKSAIALSDTALTGPLAPTILQVGEAAKNILTVAGFDELAETIDLSDEGKIRTAQFNAIRPLMREAGRGFSDKDLQVSLQAYAGLTNGREANIFSANYVMINSFNELEQAFFMDHIAGQLVTKEKTSPAGAMQNFNDYINDFPRGKQHEGNLKAIEDGQNLWKYYTEGRPTAFVTEAGDFTLQELQASAKKNGVEVRELLAQMDRDGFITGVTHD